MWASWGLTADGEGGGVEYAYNIVAHVMAELLNQRYEDNLREIS